MARSGGVTGVVSAALLGASIQWVHHWTLATAFLVAAWGLATLAALVLSTFALQRGNPRRVWAKLGLTLAAISLLALAVAGIAAAAGADPAGACGGG